jgi:hypothetical protein
VNLKIWAVWEDNEDRDASYSFTTKELAEAHAEQLRALWGGQYVVEEDLVLDRLPQRVEFHGRQGRVDPSGAVHHQLCPVSTFWDASPPQELRVDGRNTGHYGVTVTVWHQDRAEAQRIYEEQIARLVSERTGEAS